MQKCPLSREEKHGDTKIQVPLDDAKARKDKRHVQRRRGQNHRGEEKHNVCNTGEDKAKQWYDAYAQACRCQAEEIA